MKRTKKTPMVTATPQGRTVVVPFAGASHRPTVAEKAALVRVREIARQSRIGASGRS
jgi:hypothetical protein